MSEIVISMTNIQKRFGGIHALNNARLELRKGEVLGLIGENGAGKSTLMNILSGIIARDSGEIVVFGSPVNYSKPSDALDDGICMIHQEQNLIPKLNVADNIFIGRETRRGLMIDRSEDRRKAQEILDGMGVKISAGAMVSELTVAKQQMVEIAKAISFDSRILIMDEPTSALADSEIEDLFGLIRQMKAQGTSIIYISHRLEELFAITDNITVMRDGAYIDTMKTSECSMDELISKMVGRVVFEEPKQASTAPPDAPVVLEARGLESGMIHNASLKLRKGEILGFAGLMGSGRTELMRLIFGADQKSRGEIYLNGKKLRIKTPRDAVSHGIGYLSEDRKNLGLATNLSVCENIALTCWDDFTRAGVIRRKELERSVQAEADKISIKTPSIYQLVRNLSGGNQQKVVVSKWLIKNCDILIFDEPTRGIDVGAKNEIYKLMNSLVSEGKSIIMISSEMPELFRMSDRIMVMCEGRVTGELDISEATQEKIMYYATLRQEASSAAGA